MFSSHAPLIKDESASSHIKEGGKNAEKQLRLFYNDIYHVELPQGHRFPMHKYRAVRERIHHANKPNIVLQPSPIARTDDIRTTHCHEYLRRFLCNMLTDKENRNIGFPWSPQGVKRTLSSVGGTVAAMHSVCGPAGHKLAGHIAGGTHHAFRDRGEGFCVFSDIAVAANVALRDYEHIKKILIVDCDVHQGNGNAVLFQDNPFVFTFSMHCAGNFFSERQKSDLDVEIPVHCKDDDYMSLLHYWLPLAVDRSQPDLIFYQSGVDCLGGDKLGRANLTLDGLRARDALVYKTALDHKIRLVVTMGGGYPRDMSPASPEFRATINAHANVYLGAADVLVS
mmetsp:Transcript_34703/g.108649  ORF Transcript_34703/g.108649 Transcript_34703/m.108649 type:complete len:339 (-) Transcript_34703:44-1060(-)